MQSTLGELGFHGKITFTGTQPDASGSSTMKSVTINFDGDATKNQTVEWLSLIHIWITAEERICLVRKYSGCQIRLQHIQKAGAQGMRPTFMGLETAKRGLMVNQKAIDIVGNNITNMQTKGYRCV